MKQMLFIPTLIALLLIPAVGFAATEHGPITISAPGDLIRTNGITEGSGTESDPFVIADWVIDGSTTGYGIVITGVKAYILIRDVMVQSASRVGIEVINSPHVALEGCEFHADALGLSLKDLSGARVRKCRFLDCTGMGIRMSHCRGSTIIGNEFSGRNSGIVIMDSSTSNLIVENSFRGRAGLSLYLGSGGNRIFHNNFFEAVVMDSGYNVWDNGSEGNFWGKQYHGRDRNSDGIGDTPHKIQGGYNYDRHPLMAPWNK